LLMVHAGPSYQEPSMKLLGSAATGAVMQLAASALPAGPVQAMPFDAMVGAAVDDPHSKPK
jgi:hypothetical protein